MAFLALRVILRFLRLEPPVLVAKGFSEAILFHILLGLFAAGGMGGIGGIGDIGRAEGIGGAGMGGAAMGGAAMGGATGGAGPDILG
jgi:hypothetical protein